MEIDFIKALTEIIRGSNTSNIIKIILLIITGAGGFYLSHWINKKKAEAARAETMTRRRDNQQEIVEDTNTIGQDAQESENRIEDIINNRRN